MDAARLDRIFQALADPCRRRMVERLGRGPASVSALAEAARLALPSAVKHLKILEASGLVGSEKAGRVRTYGIRPDGLDPAAAWIAEREAALGAAFDRLAAAMRTIPEEEDAP